MASFQILMVEYFTDGAASHIATLELNPCEYIVRVAWIYQGDFVDAVHMIKQIIDIIMCYVGWQICKLN